MEVAKKVLEQLSAQAGVEFDFREGHIGLSALEATGSILPDETIELCKSVDAVLLGGLSGKKLEKDVSPRDCEHLVFRYAWWLLCVQGNDKALVSGCGSCHEDQCRILQKCQPKVERVL